LQIGIWDSGTGGTGSILTAHTGLDFESLEIVLSDAGETINIWQMHGHVMSPGYYTRAPGGLPWQSATPYALGNHRGNDGHLYRCSTAGTSSATGSGPTGTGTGIVDGSCVWDIATFDPDALGSPQLPIIRCGPGWFSDPQGVISATEGGDFPALRTGGILIRYKYATSGLRLKRVHGPVFQLRWWPVIAIEDEAPGVQTDNSGAICWCLNAAAVAKADAVYVDRMYYFGRVVELPDGVELRGRGPGFSGFKVMDGYAFRELLLSISSAPALADFPILKPINHQWKYDRFFFSHSPAFFPATGAKRIRISGIELDGNVEGNMGFVEELATHPVLAAAEYAWEYTNSGGHLFNVPSWGGLINTNHGNRVVPVGQVIELHNVKSHGSANNLIGNHNTEFIGTGVVEVGNAIVNHWFYFPSGVYETIRAFGYCMGDGLRVRKLIAQSVEIIPAPHPAIMFDVTGNYAVRTMNLISYNEGPQVQSQALGYPHPELSPHRVEIDHLFIDATQMDNWPAGKPYQSALPMLTGGDNIHIKSGKVRFGNLATSAEAFFNTGVNSLGLTPYRNQQIENLLIEHGSRKGFLLANLAAAGVSQLEFRNISIEQRASTTIPGDAQGGTNQLLGVWSFAETVPAAPAGSPPLYTTNSLYDGHDIEFAAIAADATLNGKFIDLTPLDKAGVAPTYRLWFNYNAAGSAPAAGGTTLIQVPVSAVAPTPAKVAQAFSLAVEGTLVSPGVPSAYLTAQTFNTVSVVGAFNYYKYSGNGGYVVCDVTNAAGVTVSLRLHRRNYEPSYISFDKLVAPSQDYLHLLSISAVGAYRELWLSFKDCILGAYSTSYITKSNSGGLNVAAVDTIKNQVHWDFENTIFDARDGTTWQNLELFLYAGKFRNCRIRTPHTATGIATLGAGFETLLSEEAGTITLTPDSATTVFNALQTKLFWVPKPGNLRLIPKNGAAAQVWGTMFPTWWRKGWAATEITDANYYQSTAGLNEDRRAPALKLNFTTAPATALGPILIGWAAAVSP